MIWHDSGTGCGHSMVVGNGILICVGVGLWVGVGQWVAVAAAWWEWVLKLIFLML